MVFQYNVPSLKKSSLDDILYHCDCILNHYTLETVLAAVAYCQPQQFTAALVPLYSEVNLIKCYQI